MAADPIIICENIKKLLGKAFGDVLVPILDSIVAEWIGMLYISVGIDVKMRDYLRIAFNKAHPNKEYQKSIHADMELRNTAQQLKGYITGDANTSI